MKLPLFLLSSKKVRKAIFTAANVSVDTSGTVGTIKISVPSKGGVIIQKIAASQDAVTLDLLKDDGNTLGGTYGLPFYLSAFPNNLEPVEVGIFVSGNDTQKITTKLTAIGTATTLTALRIEVIIIEDLEAAKVAEAEL